MGDVKLYNITKFVEKVEFSKRCTVFITTFSERLTRRYRPSNLPKHEGEKGLDHERR